jgi:hypothetical protein
MQSCTNIEENGFKHSCGRAGEPDRERARKREKGREQGEKGRDRRRRESVCDLGFDWPQMWFPLRVTIASNACNISLTLCLQIIVLIEFEGVGIVRCVWIKSP